MVGGEPLPSLLAGQGGGWVLHEAGYPVSEVVGEAGAPASECHVAQLTQNVVAGRFMLPKLPPRVKHTAESAVSVQSEPAVLLNDGA